jgi:hypothetical protein
MYICLFGVIDFTYASTVVRLDFGTVSTVLNVLCFILMNCVDSVECFVFHINELCRQC